MRELFDFQSHFIHQVAVNLLVGIFERRDVDENLQWVVPHIVRSEMAEHSCEVIRAEDADSL